MNQTLIKAGITIFPVFAIIVILDAFYSAVIIGNQLVHASIAGIGITIIGYLIALIITIGVIVAVWRKK